MQKINNFSAQKSNLRGQKNNRPKSQNTIPSNNEKTNLNGSQILSFQGKAFVDMQKKLSQKERPSLKEAEDGLRKFFEEGNFYDKTYLEKFLEYSKDEDESKQIDKLLLLTKLCKHDTYFKAVDEIFNSIEWSNKSGLPEKQISFINNMLDKDVDVFDIMDMLSTIKWHNNDGLPEKQIKTLNKMLDKKITSYCVDEIFGLIQWDKNNVITENQVSLLSKLLDKDIEGHAIKLFLEKIDRDKSDNLAEKQVTLLSKLLDKDIKEFHTERYFDLIQWERDEEVVEDQVNVLNSLLDKDGESYYIHEIFQTIQWHNSRDFQKNQINFLNSLIRQENLKDVSVKGIFSNINWDEQGNPNKNQAEFLNKLLEKKGLNNYNIDYIFGSMIWDQNGNPNKEQVDFLNELFEYFKNNVSHVGEIFYAIGWDSVDKFVAEKNLKNVRELLKDHPGSDKIWPNHEDTILLLKNGGFLRSYNDKLDDIDFNEDTDIIAQKVMERIPLEGVDKNIKKDIKSMLSKALNNPRQFLDGIPLSHTETETRIINDKGKTKSFYKMEDGKIPDIINENYKKMVSEFFVLNSKQIVKALEILDKDAVQTIFDKRFTKCEEILSSLKYKITPDNQNFIKDLISNNDKYKITINGQKQVKPLDGSGFKKVELANMILALENLYSNDLSQFFNSVESDNDKISLAKDGIIDFDKISDIIRNKILEKFEVSAQEAQKFANKGKFNGKYVHTLALAKKDKAVKDLVKNTSYGNFDSYIESKDNTYGKANFETEQMFKENNLSFDKWTKPNVGDISLEVKNKKMTIKLWSRNPYEDLFVGNKTSCCTAIGAINGNYAPLYVLSKAYNVIELYDDNNEVVGMSRVYMANVDGKLSMIMDNIELNNNYGDGKISKKDALSIRNGFFKYANEYAKQVTGDSNVQVYFSKQFTKVPCEDLKTKLSNVLFVGKPAENEMYLNVLGTSHDVSKVFNTGLYMVPKDL